MTLRYLGYCELNKGFRQNCFFASGDPWSVQKPPMFLCEISAETPSFWKRNHNALVLDSILNPDAEEECPQCSSKFLRSQGKFDPNNPKNLICATCFEAIHPSGGSTYPAVRSLKREKKVKTCPNCKTQTTSLWRKFKSADEVQRELEKKEGGKDREIDSSKPEFEGELGCNPCVLYWKLHGVSSKHSWY